MKNLDMSLFASKHTENDEITEESFSAPTADKMSSEEIISYIKNRGNMVQADHTCLIVDQRDDFAPTAFRTKNAIPMIVKLWKDDLFHFIEPTCI